MVDNPPSPLFMRIFMAAYFCAGGLCVVSATFIVAIIDHLPGLAGQGTGIHGDRHRRHACVLQLGLIARRTGDLNALILAAVPVDRRHPAAGDVGGLLAAIFGALLFGGTFIGMVSLPG